MPYLADQDLSQTVILAMLPAKEHCGCGVPLNLVNYRRSKLYQRGKSKMNENEKQLRLDSLSANISESVNFFADKIISTLGENLLSITVVGSSLTADFKPGHSDINTVLVLNQPERCKIKTWQIINTHSSPA